MDVIRGVRKQHQIVAINRPLYNQASQPEEEKKRKFSKCPIRTNRFRKSSSPSRANKDSVEYSS